MIYLMLIKVAESYQVQSKCTYRDGKLYESFTLLKKSYIDKTTIFWLCYCYTTRKPFHPISAIEFL
ncbi:hypothetical protein, partial [Fangia hongkongensis]|uniref:hypothetical protein n=1 Tax=Fangia hongkongensis TaxID=270495 RepID=UPI001F1F8DBA